MKVVINRCYGGFGISVECMKRMKELGDKTEYDFSDNYVYARGMREKSYRTSPILVQAVEELGEKANGRHSSLAIVEIPFEDMHGWRINEYDGKERIEEEHNSWY